MSIQNAIEAKKEWRLHMSRVKALPKEYYIVYKEMQKYLFKVCPLQVAEESNILSEIVDLFEEGAASGKHVLEVTGQDVASFCDELIGDTGK